MTKFIPRGFGWIPDLPDPRDYTVRHERIAASMLCLPEIEAEDLPEEVDLTRGEEDGAAFFTEVIDQGVMNSSTAFAVLNLIEYFDRRILGHTFDGSPRFLYQVAQNLQHRQPNCLWDTGVGLRTTLKTLCRIGVPPEQYCAYQSRFTHELDAFVYQLARARSDVRYFRLAYPNYIEDSESTDSGWSQIKRFLSAGFPIAFGFSVPSSLTRDSEVHYRHGLDDIRGGQAAIAVGYRLHFFGRNHHAVRFRTSWGQEWGDNGLGWFSSHALGYLARDFWTLISDDWVNSPELHCPIDIPPTPDPRQ